MNRALWKKAITEAQLLMGSLVLLMFAFHWLFVWLSSLIPLDSYRDMLKLMPELFELLVGTPFDALTTRAGRISWAYLDPVVIFSLVVWGVGRGSDAVSGEINRGTMELLLAQPVRRVAVLATQATVTTIGAVLIALAAWLGTCAGVATVPLDEDVPLGVFVPGAVNLFALMFFLAGFSTMISSGDRYRWRTIGIVGGFYVLQLVIKIVGRLVEDYEWLIGCTFLGAFEPQILIIDTKNAWSLSLQYNGALVGLGLVAYVLAAVIFARRDIPAPL